MSKRSESYLKAAVVLGIISIIIRVITLFIK